MSNKKNKKILKLVDKYEVQFLLPVIFAIAIIPLIVLLKTYKIEGISYNYWSDQTTCLDFFSYYKAVWLNITVAILIVTFLFRIKMDTFSINKDLSIYIPLSVYALFIILSALAAEHKDVAQFGFVERKEGVYVLLSYLVLLVITYNYIRTEKGVKVLIIALIASATVMGTIGLFQYLGMDPFQTTFGKQLILPLQQQKNADKLVFNFGKNSLYATLYNPNYVGSYVAMLLPIAIGFFLFVKKIWFKLASGAFVVLMAVLWFGSGSRAGLVGGAAAILVITIAMRHSLLRNYKVILAALGFVVVVGIVLNTISDGVIVRRLKSFTDTGIVTIQSD